MIIKIVISLAFMEASPTSLSLSLSIYIYIDLLLFIFLFFNYVLQITYIFRNIQNVLGVSQGYFLDKSEE